MGKRRTKKEKVHAHEKLTVSWSPDLGVNRHLKKSASNGADLASKIENADISAKDTDGGSLSRNIMKSLILALVIIAIEVVIYLSDTSLGLF